MIDCPKGPVYIDADQIASRIKELAAEIRASGVKNPHMVCVLNGAFMFFADLIRSLEMPCTVDFMQVSSYEGTNTSYKVKFLKDLQFPIEDRHVIIVEDIIDTGITMNYLIPLLQERNPATLQLASLISKPSRRIKDVKIDYLGFEIEDAYIFGYGLDREEELRYLPFVTSQS